MKNTTIDLGVGVAQIDFDMWSDKVIITTEQRSGFHRSPGA